MWRRRRRGVWTLAAVILIGACGKGSEAGSGPSSDALGDPEEAWMDQAEVRVTENLCTGMDTVELVAVGAEARSVEYSDSFAPDGSACNQAQGPSAPSTAVSL